MVSFFLPFFFFCKEENNFFFCLLSCKTLKCHVTHLKDNNDRDNVFVSPEQTVRGRAAVNGAANVVLTATSVKSHSPLSLCRGYHCPCYWNNSVSVTIRLIHHHTNAGPSRNSERKYNPQPNLKGTFIVPLSERCCGTFGLSRVLFLV